MEKISQKGFGFSITRDNIKYFRNKEKYAKNVKIMKFALCASSLLAAVSLGGLLALGTTTLVWLTTILSVTSICNGVILSYFKNEKKLCDKFWEKLKNEVKREFGPVRNLRVVKGKKFSKLRNAEFTGRRHCVENGELVTKKVVFYDEKYKEGVVSSQDILVANVAGKNQYLFAVEENKYSYVDYLPSMDSNRLGEIMHREKTGYRIVTGDMIRVDETVEIKNPKKLQRRRVR